jgi:phosphatidylinositol-3-phosphatase
VQRADRIAIWIGLVAIVVLVAAALFAGHGGPASSPGGSAIPGRPGSAGAAATSVGGATAGAPAADAVPSNRTGSPAPGGTTIARVPAFDHIYLIVFENKEVGSVLGTSSAPYLNQLAARYAVAANYDAVAHPSEPNYLALWSGSTQGVTTDRSEDFATGMTLADELEAHGRTWRVAAENVPPDCYRGATASGGEDGAGTYARKHEPAISWLSVSLNPGRCSNITDLHHFDPGAADFWLIVPNLCHDMHDCSVQTGDDWLRTFLPRIVDAPSFGKSLVLITFDEGTSADGGGGRVATLAISPLARPGFQSTIAHSHYGLLRTIEDAWDLPCLAKACSADDLADLLR